MKRNIDLDFLKLFFAFLIALGHAGYYVNEMGMLVHFYFIVSGFYLAQYYEKHKQVKAYEYTLDHVKNMWPHYLFSLSVIFLWESASAISKGQIDALKHVIAWVIPDIFFLQSSGVFMTTGLNGPAWYISVMVVGGYILYYLLSASKKHTVCFLCPITIILFYTCWQIHGLDYFGYYGIIYIPLIRGIANMAIGIILYYCKKEKMFSQLVSHNVINGLLSALCFVIVVAVCFNTFTTGFYQISLVFVTGLCVCTLFKEKSWLPNNKITSMFGKLSFAVYLNHWFVYNAYKFITGKMLHVSSGKLILLQVLVYLLCVLLYSVLTTYFVEHVKKKWKEKRQLNSALKV